MKKLPIQLTLPIAVGYAVYYYIYFDIITKNNADLYQII